MRYFKGVFNDDACITRINASLFKGRISKTQRKGLESYIDTYFFSKGLGYTVPISYLSYVIATVYHETAKEMQPVREIGKGKGKPYGETDPITGHAYYGRGDVQVTWKYNYEKLSKILYQPNGIKGVDIVSSPDLLLNPFYSSQATVLGMVSGLYTGKKLRHYLWGARPNYKLARKIINGLDKADMIASYAMDIEKAIRIGMKDSIDRDVLKVGSQGDDVRELQLMLGLNPDGIFGRDTATEVKRHQSNVSLKDDGIVGFDTWQSLEQKVYWGAHAKNIDVIS